MVKTGADNGGKNALKRRRERKCGFLPFFFFFFFIPTGGIDESEGWQEAEMGWYSSHTKMTIF